MTKAPIFGLVCAGGGAHGAYQVGVLKYIHEHFSNGHHSPFQIFTGASCGALNTTFFAAESFNGLDARLRLEELWHNFHVPGYHGNTLKNALVSLFKEWRLHPDQRQNAWALLDPQPMKDVIAQGFKRESLDRSLREKTTLGVGIAATELISGRTCWFQEGHNVKSWNLFHSIGLADRLTGSHLAASCSIPIFLPPVKLGDHYFLDGSVALDKPLSAAVSMGATRVLSIATDKPIPTDLPHYPAHFRPRISNVIRLLLNRLSHDAAGDEASEIETFNRFYSALSNSSRRPKKFTHFPLFHEEHQPADYHHTEIFRFFPSKRIRDAEWIADESFKPGIPKKRTRFMFHKTFIKDLIHLGYEDAKSKHKELIAFFHPQESQNPWLAFLQKEPQK